ncbi:ribonuclease inhibitor [Labedella endophytica]|uniref:Ribonuclease inhibitor n=1 Tax=Labedella endophytica TaxID=1523160 RepID=A0A433JQR6_9MICO|nr:ribonuclease inhibitor [Labedella endophytica]RUQ99217.1 ribonuclease inhibitor [Labedella endophytica]
MSTEFRIEGTAVVGILSFYDELNRVFMAGESWTLGPSLDALDDMLYGGYGALHGLEGARVVWTDHAASRHALGRSETIAHHRSKLDRPGTFNAERARSAIADLEAGTGSTYFDTVLEIFESHPRIELVLA